jgi:hypothetical protein
VRGAPWRFFDAPMPDPFDIHDDCDTDGWRMAVEGFAPPGTTGIVLWDGPAWDSTTNFWSSGDYWADVAGDLMGIEHEAGRNDVDGRMEASVLRFTLDNRSGRYTQFVLSGGVPTTAQFFPGRRIALWHDRIDEPPDPRPRQLYAFPRFYGVIETWEENLGTPEGFPPVINGLAVDGFARLNERTDAVEWVMGDEGDNPFRRIDSLLNLAGWPTSERRRLDQGNVTLIKKASTSPILEVMHHTADSDGGVVYIDTDGSFMYRDRRWVYGRDDQMGTPTFDDICSSSDALDFWTGDPLIDETDVVNVVVMENENTVKVLRDNAASLGKYGRHAWLGGDGMLWRTFAEGVALADFILMRRADLYWRFTELQLYPTDENGLWEVVDDMRIGDEVIVRRTIRPGQQLVATCIIQGFKVEMTVGGVWRWTLHLMKGQ